MKPILDNLILYVDDVTLYQFDNFRRELEIAETYGKIPRVSFYIGTRITKYHYNLTIGQGAGAVHIGYKHNTSKENKLDGYRLRLEVNPSKKSGTAVDDAREWFNAIFIQSFVNNTKLIKGIDIAYDVPVAINRLFTVSLTGRQRNINKGTIYYGERGQHGNLKIYDKKKELKEKQGIEIKEEHLTRIEYSVRLDEPMTIHFFGQFPNMGINKMYQVSELKIGETEGVVKACLIAINSGEMQIGELSRTYQNKTKKALADMGLLDLDHAYTNAKKEIIKVIQKYLITSKDTILSSV